MVFLLHRCSAQFLVFSRLDKVTLLIATCQLLHNEFYLHLSMSRFNQVHFYLFIYFWLFWVFIAAQAVLQLQRVGTTLPLQRMGFSLWCLLIVDLGLQSTDSVVMVLRLSCSKGWWNLPGSGIKPMSPATADRFFTTQSSGKCLFNLFVPIY